MYLRSPAFHDLQTIPAEYAFGIPDPTERVTLGANRNPPLTWGDVPEGTQSLVLILHDPDVPTQADDVNQEGRTVPVDLPRMAFYHWILVDIPPTLTEIAAGAFSDGVTFKGKSGPEAPYNARQGINNYREWFGNDPAMGGDYFGYDGPCPPWNDSIIHHYIFTLYALDIARCPVEGHFTAPNVLAHLHGHVLAEARLTGIYSLNPAVPA